MISGIYKASALIVQLLLPSKFAEMVVCRYAKMYALCCECPRMTWIKSSAGYDGRTAWRTLTFLWRVKKGVVSVKKQTGDEVVNIAQLLPVILQNSTVIIPNEENRAVTVCNIKK